MSLKVAYYISPQVLHIYKVLSLECTFTVRKGALYNIFTRSPSF